MTPRITVAVMALCCFCVVFLPLAGGFLVNLPSPLPSVPHSATTGITAKPSSLASGRWHPGAGPRIMQAWVDARHKSDASAQGMGRYLGASRIYSGMARLSLSSALGTNEAGNDSSVPTGTANAGDTPQQQDEDPLKRLEKEMFKEGGHKMKAKRHPNDYRKDGDWSKKKKAAAGDSDSQLAVAFSAFSDALLRPGQGRVRFSTIVSTFRDEFPTLAPESKISNQTLGRKLQAWYKDKTGNELKREPGGPYAGLSIVNPRFTSVDLTSLRAAQALFEPGMKKKFEALGLPVHTNTAGKQQYEKRMKSRKTRTAQEQRVTVHKNSKGKVIRVVRRANPEKGIKEKVVSGRPIESQPSRVQQLRKAGPAAKVCITSFCATLLVDEGSCTFSDVKASFLSHFPLLSSSDRMTDSYFGRVVSDWYCEKYGVALTRTKTKEMAALNMSRSQVPFTSLSIRPANDAAVDMALLNEAKVALRRSLEMEGVGVLVKRDAVSETYKVAMIAEGSPAHKEGSIHVGDTMISIGKQPTSDMDVQQLADAVLGRRGTKVKLTLGRLGSDGELGVFTVVLTRKDERSAAMIPSTS